MFNLSEIELENAYSAINHHGYSTMLPEPMEWVSIKNRWVDVRDYIKSIDLDTYTPFEEDQEDLRRSGDTILNYY